MLYELFFQLEFTGHSILRIYFNSVRLALDCEAELLILFIDNDFMRLGHTILPPFDPKREGKRLIDLVHFKLKGISICALLERREDPHLRQLVKMEPFFKESG